MDRDKLNKINKAIDFFEELTWLLESRKDLRLTEIPMLLKELSRTSSRTTNVAKEYTSPNPNIHFLIGVLPRLFRDNKLFASNETIAKFAEEVLNIHISRYDKRSKYELIGLVVCETDTLSDQKLSRLVKALAEITENEEKLNKMREAQKKDDFSWNETIQKLTGNL